MSLRTYVLQNVTSLSNLASVQDDVETALQTPGIYGSSWRMPWTSVSDSLLSAIAAAAGPKPFAVRFMAGRYTPPASMGRSFVYNGAETNGQGAGSKIPVPFSTNGGANATFESAWRGQVDAFVAFSVAHGCPVVHLPWPGLLWAELALVAQEQSLSGYSMDAAAAAHLRMLNAAVTSASSASADLTVEFPISGHAPQELRNRITTAVKADPILKARVLIQSNNVDDSGGGLPAPGDMRRGLQMVGTGDYAWDKVFKIAEGFESLEVYTQSFLGANAAALRAEIAASSGELERLALQLSALRSVLPVQVAAEQTAATQLGFAHNQVLATQAQIAQTEAEIAALG